MTLIDEFGDLKALESAFDQIFQVGMKSTQDVRQYYREFSEISVRLRDWGDGSFAQLLFKGLSPEIQLLVSNTNHDFPMTLKGMRDVAVQAFRRKEQLQGELKDAQEGRLGRARCTPSPGNVQRRPSCSRPRSKEP